MLQTPRITRHLLIINLLCFLATLVGEGYGIDLNDIFGLHFFLASDFRLYQLVTYMFMHGSWSHILINMLMLWMFARSVEPAWGERRFLIFYLVCGLGAAVCQELVQLVEYHALGLAGVAQSTYIQAGLRVGDYLNMWNTVGASGSIYGVLLAFAMTFPNARILLLIPPIPLKAKYMALLCIAIELYSAWHVSGDGVAHCAHLGGMLFGWLLIRRWRRQDKQSANSGQYWSWTEYKPAKPGKKERLKAWWKKVKETARREATDDMKTPIDDEEREAQKQREIDRILEKIKHSGYSSLSDDEKRKLFEAGDK